MSIIAINNGFPSYQNASSLEEMQASYSLKETIQKIKELSQSGEKVCLFIGRTISESLPKEEGVIWISGDREFVQTTYSADSSSINSLKEKIHICCDFTDEKSMGEFRGLFNKIVIDRSTCKFMDGDFISRFARLLKPYSESNMIFEKTPYTTVYSTEVKEPQNRYSYLMIPDDFLYREIEENDYIIQRYNRITGSSQKASDFIKFKEEQVVLYKLNNIHDLADLFSQEDLEDSFNYFIANKLRSSYGFNPSCSESLEVCVQETKKHMEKIFQKVELIENSSYPYSTNYSHEEKKEAFFIATGLRPEFDMHGYEKRWETVFKSNN
jgi:hypothetical protein